MKDVWREVRRTPCSAHLTAPSLTVLDVLVNVHALDASSAPNAPRRHHLMEERQRWEERAREVHGQKEA